jgi:hypothetical protein
MELVYREREGGESYVESYREARRGDFVNEKRKSFSPHN